MKAIVQDVYGSPDVLRLEEIEAPTPGPHDVLIRVRAAGIDPSALHLMTGTPYAIRLAGFGVFRPKIRVRGNDVAGVVEAIGSSVTTLKVGDAVFGTTFGTKHGAFAELTCAPASQFVSKPSSLSFEQAAVVPVSACTALVCLRAGNVSAGKKVLIIGAAGGIGTFAVQLATSLGASVTAVCSTSKLELVRSLGATHAIDYTRESSLGTGYDVILDIAGNRPLSVLRRALTERGTLVFVGGEHGGQLTGMGRQIIAMLISPFVKHSFKLPLGLVTAELLRELSAMFDAGTLKPVVDRTYALAETPAALRSLSEWKARGKLVVSL